MAGRIDVSSLPDAALADPPPRVSVAQVRPIALALTKLGVPQEAFLGELGLTVEAREGTVPVVQFRAAIHGVAARLGMRHLALELVKNLPLGIYGNADYGFSTRATLMDALLAYAPKQGSYSEAVRWELVPEGDIARIVQRPLFRFDAPNPVGVEFDNAFVVRRFRDVLGDAAVEVKSVRFTHEAPPDTSMYDEFFGVRVEFGAEQSDVAFPVRLFQEPLLTANPALAEMLARDAAPPRLVRQDPFVRDVRAAIGALLAESSSSTSLGDVAERLGASTRSLQRRLSERGVSFSELVDQERRELAKALLAREGTLLCEIAYRLGFSGVSPFLRAFRRWTGTSPSAFRSKPAE